MVRQTSSTITARLAASSVRSRMRFPVGISSGPFGAGVKSLEPIHRIHPWTMYVRAATPTRAQNFTAPDGRARIVVWSAGGGWGRWRTFM